MERTIFYMIVVWSVVMYGVMFLHLDADFPYHSPWNDWSKITDEGWYAGGALHYFVFGHWYLPAAFNAAVAMPVWSWMTGGWFAAFGVGMVQVRALAVVLYGFSLLLLYALLRRAGCSRLAASIAVLLMVVNPFCYVFDRMAILEPVMVFWWLLSLWVAGRAVNGRVAWSVLLGVLIAVLLLTKATAVLLSISALFYLYIQARQRDVMWLKSMVTAIITAMVLWGLYFFGLVRPFYFKDYHFLFAINAYRIHLSIVPRETLVLFRDGLWVGKVLFPLSVLGVAAAAVWFRKLWTSPLFASVVAASALYMAFILYHANFQPRYYLVIAMPVVIVLVMLVDRAASELKRSWVAIAGVGVAVLMAVVMTSSTVRYALQPTFTYRDTAREIASVMRAGAGTENPLLWAAGGDDIALFTGIRSVALYTPEGFDALRKTYPPQWAALSLNWEDPNYRQMSQLYHLEAVRSFPVYNDVEHHQQLVLYRVTPR